MANQRKGAVKGLILFLIVMAALTFFSHTIYYGTLPKVEAQRVSGGILQTTIAGTSLLLDSDRVIRVEIPVDLADCKLRVDQVMVQKHAPVTQGAELVAFDPMQGENALLKSEAAHQRAVEALEAWDLKYQAAWKKLGSDMDSARKKMTEEGADLDALAAQLQTLQDEQATLERTRMLDGVSRAEKEQARSDAKAVLSALTEIRSQGWAVVAPRGGVVSDVPVKAGDEYAGLLPLVRLIPPDAKLRVGVETDSKLEIGADTNTTVYGGDDAPGSGELGWSYAGESVVGGKRVLWAETDGELPDLTKLGKLSFRVDSDYCQHLISNAALVGGNAVYLLDTRSGAWGEDEYYARKVEVRGLQSDGKNTSVAAGLGGMDNVIVRWDRPFSDGDTVALSLD